LGETVLIKRKRFKKYTLNAVSLRFSATYGREQTARLATQRNSAHRHAFGTDPVSPATFRTLKTYTLHAALILYDLSSMPRGSLMIHVVIFILFDMHFTILIAIKNRDGDLITSD